MEQLLDASEWYDRTVTIQCHPLSLVSWGPESMYQTVKLFNRFFCAAMRDSTPGSR